MNTATALNKIIRLRQWHCTGCKVTNLGVGITPQCKVCSVQARIRELGKSVR